MLNVLSPHWAMLQKFWTRPQPQYLHEEVPHSNNPVKQWTPRLYYYLTLKPLNKQLRFYRTQQFLISFPKCGRTWLRTLIGKYLSDYFSLNSDDLTHLKELSKQIGSMTRMLVIHEDQPHYKTPSQLTRTKDEFKNKKVIFLVRDPRDVIVSLFYQRKKDLREYSKTMSEHVREEVGGFGTILEYYRIWYENQCIPSDFLLIRYEDMHEDTGRELRRTLEFLTGQVPDEELIRESVEYCQFRKMKRREQKSKGPSEHPNPYMKARKGKIGGYVEELSDRDVHYLNERLNNSLPAVYGYRVASSGEDIQGPNPSP